MTTLLDMNDVLDLIYKDPNRKLILHWEGSNNSSQTTPKQILLDIANNVYTLQEFDEIGYLMTIEDYETFKTEYEQD